MNYLSPAMIFDKKTVGRSRAVSDQGLVAESTSDDTKSSGAEEVKTNSNPQGEDEISLDDERFIGKSPITASSQNLIKVFGNCIINDLHGEYLIVFLTHCSLISAEMCRPITSLIPSCQ